MVATMSEKVLFSGNGYWCDSVDAHGLKEEAYLANHEFILEHWQINELKTNGYIELSELYGGSQYDHVFIPDQSLRLHIDKWYLDNLTTLEHLLMAVKKEFWMIYSEDHPPKNCVIERWLTDNSDISQQDKKAIARLSRPNHLK